MTDNISSLGFNGEYFDDTLDNYHLGNGYRAYNPSIMAFTAPDDMSPFGHGGINPYMYVSGDPINNTDPTGHVNILTFAGGALLFGFSAVSAGAAIFSLITSGGATALPAFGVILGSMYGMYAGLDQMVSASHQSSNITGEQWKNLGINVGITVAAELGGALLGIGIKALAPEASRYIGSFFRLSRITANRERSESELLLADFQPAATRRVSFADTVEEYVTFKRINPIRQSGESESHAIIRELRARSMEDSSGITFGSIMHDDDSITPTIETDGNYVRLNKDQVKTLQQSNHLLMKRKTRVPIAGDTTIVHNDYIIKNED